MLQCILTVACPEFHLTKQLDKFRMDTMNANFQKSRFALLAHHVFHFFLCFLYHLFDSGRMNPSIHNQTFQCNTRYLSPDWIEARQDNCLRRIVDDQFHARQSLQCTNISSLTSDNSSLHLIIRKLYD